MPESSANTTHHSGNDILSSRRQLARNLTLAESNHPADRQRLTELLASIQPPAVPAVRLGISGPPGVGKSTFIEALGVHLVRGQARKVAVLAVDPSSPLRGGSLLADKTRMENLSREDNAFIRPAPSKKNSGGVAQGTEESILLCEAAGYDTVMIETVGVGQCEYEVAGMVDLFVLLAQPAAGDLLQGIKRGIIELADMIVINKADGLLQTAAEQAASQYAEALKLNHEKTPVDILSCSALENNGIEAIWEALDKRFQHDLENGHLQHRRAEQNINHMEQLISRIMMSHLFADEQLGAQRRQLAQSVSENHITPHNAALQLATQMLKQTSDR